jgi:hypothetical protein
MTTFDTKPLIREGEEMKEGLAPLLNAPFTLASDCQSSEIQALTNIQ